MKRRRLAAGLGLVVVALLLALAALWLARATIAAKFARDYFRSHGVNATVEIGMLGLSGVSGRFALGPDETPDLSAERVEVHFDPLRWLPYVVEVRLVNPVVRAQLADNGQVRLGSLQDWLDSLRKQPGKSPYVSDDLVVSLTGLRVFLLTPAGTAEVDGDLRLVKSLPETVALTLRPARLAWRGYAADIAAGRLAYDNRTGQTALALSGDIKGKGLDLRGLNAGLQARGLHWSLAPGFSLGAPAAELIVTAADINGAQAVDIKVAIANFAFAAAPMAAQAELRLRGTATAGALLPSFRTGDVRLDRALTANLARLQIEGAATLRLQQGHAAVNFTTPLKIAGAQGGALTLQNLQLASGANGLSFSGFRAVLRGAGLPRADVEVRDLAWRDAGLTAHARLNADFDYAMLRRASLRGAGALSWQAGRYGFTPAGCANISLAAFRPGTSDVAKDIRATLCGAGGAPLLAGEGVHWRLIGQARGVGAFLPLANSQLDKADAKLDFQGEGTAFRGQAAVGTAHVTDKTTPSRFKPISAGGMAAFAAGVWRGQFAVASDKSQPLGEVTFSHTVASGAGAAHIAAPTLTFAVDRLQPEDLSPSLATFRRAEGAVDFQGDIAWTRDAITSRGTVAIASLDFLTPLGKAHAIKTKLDFVSLLPPQTAPGQTLTIARIDWTLPFSGVDLRFSFTPASIKVDALSTGWAEGSVSLTPFTIATADPSKVAGTAALKSIALNALITASNLGSKIKLEGKVSGQIPFATGPDGIRITKGHIAADGPGRLAVDRSVWTQGDAAINSNAVQDFAYQALENLAFESMSADLNSIANGRLQVVFHIKGKFDPPKPQTADIAVADILNGTALQKPIPLPSGTPVDLTLDTSLNFDELLKSYAEAWSKALNPGATP